MVRQCRKLTAAGVLLGAAFSLSASAEPKTEAGKAGKAAPPQAAATGLDKQERGNKADKAQAKTDKLEAKADKAEAKSEVKAAKAEAKAEKAEAKAEGEAEDHDGAPNNGRGKFKSAVSELREKYKNGSLNKAELDKELRALKESRKERRSQHQRAIKERWGNGLAAPAAREELAHHERRMAKLNRLLLLAEAERKGTVKEELVERIEKLIAHENERHERKMTELATPRARGSLNAPASTSPTSKAAAEVPAGQAPKTRGEK